MSKCFYEIHKHNIFGDYKISVLCNYNKRLYIFVYKKEFNINNKYNNKNNLVTVL